MESQKLQMVSRNGKEIGTIKNLKSRRCRLTGCFGMCAHVKWSEGKSTYPCLNGCRRIDEYTWRIL